ncbi:MAG: response regulator, partial [Candidatus Electrothrix sp. MAN1_4]|nr:response regulator [Candidatus Electrothrix sp. MAN1_4]
HQEEIFEPFRQVGDRLHHSEGSGLGLSISSRLVMLMGGDLQLISPLNKEQAGCEGAGSRFFFTLDVPVLQHETVTTQDSIQKRISGYTCTRPKESHQKQRILVVDDVPSNRAVLRDILESVGFIVHEAKDGESVLKSSQTNQPDLILMDLLMPRTDGLTAGLQVRQHKDFSHIPIIAVSALVTEKNKLRQQCLEHGFNAALGKPCSASNLLETIAQHLPITLVYGEKENLSGLEECVIPSSEVLDELNALVEIGDINGISKKIKYICEMDTGEYSVFCCHLKKYFDEFQFTKLLHFIAANRSRTVCKANKTQYS